MFTESQKQSIQTQALSMLRKSDFSFRSLLKLIRRESRLSRRDFAFSVGVDESTIKRIETTDDYNPTQRSLERILTPAGLAMGFVVVNGQRWVPKSPTENPKSVSAPEVTGSVRSGEPSSSIASDCSLVKPVAVATPFKERYRVVDGVFEKIA